MKLLTTMILLGQLETPVQKVDFRLVSPSVGATADGATREETAFSGTSNEPDQTERKGGRATAPKSTHFHVARGFGSNVPLDFAARQIIPAGFRVVYSPGTDRQRQLSWQGGQPWNRVLQDAIRPLGLRMTVAGQVVTIAR